MENVDPAEVRQAMRSHPGLGLELVDYDTLVHSYLSAPSGRL
jgi:hypothetical protein